LQVARTLEHAIKFGLSKEEEERLFVKSNDYLKAFGFEEVFQEDTPTEIVLDWLEERGISLRRA